MILNHKAAIELLVDQAGEIGFNRYSILNLHALACGQPACRPAGHAAACGAFRWASTVRSTIRWKCRSSSRSASIRFWTPRPRSRTPFEQAFFALAHLAYLQGFEDVNKRVSPPRGEYPR